MKRVFLSICPLVIAALLVGVLVLALQLKAEAAPAALFGDDFEDGNDDGWTVQSGDWAVTPEYSEYRVSYTGSSPDSRRSYYSTTASATWTDYAIQARMKVMTPTADNRWGMLMVRYQDSNNYYYLAFQGDGRLRIRKYAGGGSTTIDTVDPGLSRDTWYTLTLEVSGDTTPTLRAYVNGTAVLTVTDTSGSPFTSGTCALGSYQGTAHFDDVVVTEGGTSTVLLSEDFDDGVADDWVVQSGDWDIFANYIYRVDYPDSSPSSRRSYAGSPTWTDYAVQAKVKIETPIADGRWGMLMVRYQDSDNYYYLAFQGDGRLRIRKYVGGSSSTIDTVDPGLSRDTWYTLTLEVSGDTTPMLRAYVNGTAVLTVTDTSGSPFTSGQFALGSYQGDVQFDDVVVTDLSAYTLTVTKAGSGSGTVTSDPAGIDCGITCTADFDASTVVTLTATPDGSDTFVGWMGAGCSGTGTCVITMDGAKDVTAIFSSAANPTLVVLKDGPGSGTVTSEPAGINCGGTCIAGFPASSVVTLTAAADTGSTFAGWSGAGCSGTGTCVVTMDAVKTVTATFVQGPFDLDVTKSGNGDGTVTSDPAGIDCGVTCTHAFDASTVVTLTAAADGDSVFAGWSGAGCSGTGDCVVTMLMDTEVTAAFMSLTQTLSVSKTGNGTGSVTSDPAGIDCGGTCSADYSYGTAVTLTAAAAGDSVFAGWSGAGCSGTADCVVTMDDTQDVVAAFMSLTQTLSIAKTGSGIGSVSSDPAGIDCGGTCSADYSYGTAVTLTATPGTESAFIGWNGGGCSGTGDCVVTMDDTKAITAAFKFNATLPFTDDFESGSGQWTVQNGEWATVLENTAYRVYYPGSGTSSMRSYYDGPYASTWTDYAIQARVKVESSTSSSGFAQLMVRWQDSKNYYYLALEGDGDVKIRKYVDGSSSTMDSADLDLELDKWYTLKLEVSGDTTPVLRASVDGTPVLTVTDTSGSPYAAGTCAIGSSKGTAQFDDVVVTVIAPLDGVGSGDFLPNTTLLIEDFEDSVADDWVVQAGNWSIVENHVYNTVYTDGVSPSMAQSYVGAPTWTDYSFEARVRPISGTYAMLITRWQDEGNYYLMALRLNNGKVEVKRMTPTGSVGLGSANANITAGEWYTAKFEVEGNQLRCYIDGELILTLTDDVLTWGEVGVGTLRANADFDDVLVTSLVPTYTLTVDTTGSGTGSVTSDPVGLIDCGTSGITCTATLERGTVVTLTATPDGGDTFAGWMGACSGTGDCVVTMDEAKNVTAVFSDPANPMLIVYKDGTGDGTVTSVPAGIDCDGTCAFSFTQSTVVTLTAVADTYSEFTGWSGEGCSGTGTCVVTMDMVRTVTATFTHVAYPLTVIKDGAGTGTVTSDPAGIDCGSTCSASMSGVVTLTATPDTASSFTGWAGEGCSGTGTCVVTMDAAKTVTATFEAYACYLPIISVDLQPVTVAPLYVAPGGSDSNPGTMALPFKTVSKAVSVAVAGQTIYMRGGTYYYTETVTLSKSGNYANMYKIWAYPGEQPVLDFSGVTPGSFARGFLITGNFWHLKGLEIQYAPDNGVKIEGNHNIVERCVFHHNQDTGLQIGFGSTPSNADGLLAAYNQIINCDSYRNYDEATHGSNADGFACKLHAGKGNSFTGCRAWENSDDGWDLFQTYYPVTIENSWTWHNGDKDLLGYTGTSWGGNGNGFKVGGNYYEAAHILTGCIAFDNAYESGKGFDQNHNMGSITVYNSVAWGNLTNFSFNEDPTDGGTHVLRNNVSFSPVTADTALAPTTVHDHNSWNLAVTADAADFVSLSETLAKAPRQADGSLPDNGFARLVAGSDLIDQGVDVGLPYCGAAPDLGAFEYCTSPDTAKLPVGGLAFTLGGGALGMVLTHLPKKRRQDAV
jgi:uncharacterized protein (DUF2141 family)